MKALTTIVFVFIINSVIGQNRELFDVQKHIQANFKKQNQSKQQDAIEQFRNRFQIFIPAAFDDQIKKNEKSSIAGKIPTLTFQKPTMGLMPTLNARPVTSGKIPDSQDRWRYQ